MNRLRRPTMGFVADVLTELYLKPLPKALILPTIAVFSKYLKYLNTAA